MTRRRARARFWSEAWLRRWTARGFVILLTLGLIEHFPRH